MKDKTIVLATRIRPTTLANLALLVDETGSSPVSRADILRQALELLEMLSIEKQWIIPVSDTVTSIGTLRTMGINIASTEANAEVIAGILRSEVTLPKKEHGDSEESLLEIARKLMEEQK